jgi:hypothetical protein
VNEAEVERMLLDHAVDDFTGLWEVNWWLDYRFPDESPATRRQMAESCLRNLVSRALVELFRGTTFQGDEVVVPVVEIDAALADDEWEPSAADKLHSRFLATDAGQSHFQDLGKDSVSGRRRRRNALSYVRGN